MATWSNILSIFYPSNNIGGQTLIFDQVLTQMEQISNLKNGFEWRDVDDSVFFENAIEKCFFFPENSKHVHRLHNLLMSNNNIKFLSTDESYTKYL